MARGKKRDEVNNNTEEIKDTEITGSGEADQAKADTAEENNSQKAEGQEKDDIKEETAEAEKTTKENEELIKKNQEIEALNNKLLRLQADYLNFKDRTEREKLSTYGDAIAATICDLLPVIDNFERAIATETNESDPFKEGVVMVYNQLMGILSKKGLKEIDALHKPFDHNLHYGVGYEECEEFDDGIVIDVLQKGYTVNDKLIRPAMVRICKKS
ncbi:MAG TPA: nucleotide exchange factor GrpE [Sedimentibacter sp.]|jgi:molecular chaperone GrpE|nr:nucleotide exchange factor GrpE [Tissierellia bacterium]HRC81250.1 nucleotide exchange factor GrpE [Sedimentibacter sp.]